MSGFRFGHIFPVALRGREGGGVRRRGAARPDGLYSKQTVQERRACKADGRPGLRRRLGRVLPCASGDGLVCGSASGPRCRRL